MKVEVNFPTVRIEAKCSIADMYMDAAKGDFVVLTSNGEEVHREEVEESGEYRIKAGVIIDPGDNLSAHIERRGVDCEAYDLAVLKMAGRVSEIDHT